MDMETLSSVTDLQTAPTRMKVIYSSSSQRGYIRSSPIQRRPKLSLLGDRAVDTDDGPGRHQEFVPRWWCPRVVRRSWVAGILEVWRDKPTYP